MIDNAIDVLSRKADSVEMKWLEKAYKEHALRPSIFRHPKVFMEDSNTWCALDGDDLQIGICGFGASPELAMQDFDRAWRKALKPPTSTRE